MSDAACFNRLLLALVEARRLNNQTVRSASDVADWHTNVDALLAELGDPSPEERYDAPHRKAHRQFVRELFQ